MTSYAESAYATDMEDMKCEHLRQRFTHILKNSHEQPFSLVYAHFISHKNLYWIQKSYYKL